MPANLPDALFHHGLPAEPGLDGLADNGLALFAGLEIIPVAEVQVFYLSPFAL